PLGFAVASARCSGGASSGPGRALASTYSLRVRASASTSSGRCFRGANPAPRVLYFAWSAENRARLFPRKERADLLARSRRLDSGGRYGGPRPDAAGLGGGGFGAEGGHTRQSHRKPPKKVRITRPGCNCLQPGRGIGGVLVQLHTVENARN